MKAKNLKEELYLTQTENRHLKDTIVALRDELEKQNIETEDRIQKAVAEANDQILQLKETITALRDEMEHNKIIYEDKMQEQKRAYRDEKKQLEQMISALRDKIENKNAK